MRMDLQIPKLSTATLRFEPAAELFSEGQFCPYDFELLSGTVALFTEPGNRCAPYVRHVQAGQLIGVAEGSAILLISPQQPPTQRLRLAQSPDKH